ncbi:MAG: hypothetical protein NC300_03210 [Bacteroidales bacterium]|nr:hypothetical protein [Clostridium sp.]MCM1203127.1 hypothetical protein [Bacteroidales bacterium]
MKGKVCFMLCGHDKYGHGVAAFLRQSVVMQLVEGLSCRNLDYPGFTSAEENDIVRISFYGQRAVKPVFSLFFFRFPI